MNRLIKAYTFNAAYEMRQEGRVGSLKVDKFADFIILSQDIFTIDPSQISQTKVEMTVLNGEVIYKK